jgi:hypothetical protein
LTHRQDTDARDEVGECFVDRDAVGRHLHHVAFVLMHLIAGAGLLRVVPLEDRQAWIPRPEADLARIAGERAALWIRQARLVGNRV